MEATLENRGENAYSTVLNISFSRNLQFASLIPKVSSRGDPGSSRGAAGPGQMGKLQPKAEPKSVSIPHKSELFMGSVSKHFQLFILEMQKRLSFNSLSEGQTQRKLFPSIFLLLLFKNTPCTRPSSRQERVFAAEK